VIGVFGLWLDLRNSCFCLLRWQQDRGKAELSSECWRKEEEDDQLALAIALLFVSGKGFESEGEYMYVSLCVLV
jgi:hypothetical protein